MRRAYAVRRSRAAGWAKLCGGLAVPVLVLAALGARAGFIPGAALLGVLAVGFVLALMAVGIAAYALADVWNNGSEGTGPAVAGIVYALPALALLGLVAGAAIVYPRVADVTTDPDNPPRFVASPDRRSEADAAARQREAYPDIVTQSYPLPLGEVYATARSIIEERGWTIVRDSRPALVLPSTRRPNAAPQVGETEELIRALAQKSVMIQSRGGAAEASESAADAELAATGDESDIATLEATAATPVFGFRDSVVLRLRPSAEGTEVDMRSASNIGEHDLGQNARRIRWFFKQLDLALQPGSASGVASAGR
jgi:uncharacterized protein (DUF1499 family)